MRHASSVATKPNVVASPTTRHLGLVTVVTTMPLQLPPRDAASA